MTALVGPDREPITTFLSRVRELYDVHGVSTILVVGGCGAYLSVADTVIMMDAYQAIDVTQQARALVLSAHLTPSFHSTVKVETACPSLGQEPNSSGDDDSVDMNPTVGAVRSAVAVLTSPGTSQSIVAPRVVVCHSEGGGLDSASPSAGRLSEDSDQLPAAEPVELELELEQAQSSMKGTFSVICGTSAVVRRIHVPSLSLQRHGKLQVHEMSRIQISSDRAEPCVSEDAMCTRRGIGYDGSGRTSGDIGEAGGTGRGGGGARGGGVNLSDSNYAPVNECRGDDVRTSAIESSHEVGGDLSIHLGSIEQLVEVGQTRAIAELFDYIVARLYADGIVQELSSINDIIDAVEVEIDVKGLGVLETGRRLLCTR